MSDAPRLRSEAAIVALVAEFIGAITGLRPPLERSLFPPDYEPALKRLCDGLMQIMREQNATRRQEGLGGSTDGAASTARVGEAQKAAVSEEACRTGVKASGATPETMQHALEIIHATNEWIGSEHVPSVKYREHLQRGIAAALVHAMKPGEVNSND